MRRAFVAAMALLLLLHGVAAPAAALAAPPAAAIAAPPIPVTALAAPPAAPLPAPSMHPAGDGFSPPMLVAGTPPRLSADSALLMDWETGEVLFALRPFARRAPASTTKILTALIALEQGNRQAVVTVSRRAADTPGSSMHIRAGERYSLHDLLQGLLLRSGNDAAVAIAEQLSGSVEAFAERMNQRAAALGARQSHFMNPHGLDHQQHYTTAYDLALITRQAMANPVFAAVVSQRARQLEFELLGRESLLTNTNRLLWNVEGADGVKTGTTGAAGACLVASATRTGQRLVAVVLHSRNRWADAGALLEYGYRHYRLYRYAAAGEVLTQAGVAGALPPQVPVAAGGDLAVVGLQGGEPPRLSLRLQSLQAPLPAGAQVGEAELWLNGGVRRRLPLLAAAAVPRATPLRRWLYGAAAFTRAVAPFGGAG